MKHINRNTIKSLRALSIILKIVCEDVSVQREPQFSRWMKASESVIGQRGVPSEALLGLLPLASCQTV